MEKIDDRQINRPINHDEQTAKQQQTDHETNIRKAYPVTPINTRPPSAPASNPRSPFIKPTAMHRRHDPTASGVNGKMD